MKPLDDSEAGDMEISSLLEYHLFDGTLYRVLPGKTCLKEDTCYVKLEVAYHRPSGVAEKGELDEVSKKTPEEYALDAQKMNERLSPWIYVIPKWQHEAYITDLDQLLEKPDRKKTKKD